MRILALSLLAAAACSTAFASGVNIKMSGNQDPACTPGLICDTDGGFVSDVNGNGGGFSDVVNATGGFITSISLSLGYVDPNCPSGTPTPVNLTLDPTFLVFATQSLSVSSQSVCTNMQSSGGFEAVYSLSLNFLQGIPESDLFQISLNSDGSGNPNGAGGWIPEETLAVVTASPEPSMTVALSLAFAGFLGFGIRRVRRA